MFATRDNLVRAVYTRVRSLNGSDTEEALNMIISEKLVDNNMATMHNNFDVNDVADKSDIKENGVWVYSECNDLGWVFERYNTVADAIRRAVTVINSIIIHNGREIPFDTLEDGRAYYIDDDYSIRLVDLM